MLLFRRIQSTFQYLPLTWPFTIALRKSRVKAVFLCRRTGFSGECKWLGHGCPLCQRLQRELHSDGVIRGSEESSWSQNGSPRGLWHMYQSYHHWTFMNCLFRHPVKKTGSWEGAHIIIRSFAPAGLDGYTGHVYWVAGTGCWCPGIWSHSDWPVLTYCRTFLNVIPSSRAHSGKGSMMRNTNSESSKGSYCAGQTTDRTD